MTFLSRLRGDIRESYPLGNTVHMHFRDGSIADSSGTVSHTSLKALLVSAVAVVQFLRSSDSPLACMSFSFSVSGSFLPPRGPTWPEHRSGSVGQLMPPWASLNRWSGGWWMNVPTSHPPGGELLAFWMLPKRSQGTSIAATLIVYHMLIQFTFLPDSLPASPPLFSRISWGFPNGSEVKNQPAMMETWVQSLGQEDPLEKGMTTHSSILAWRIPWTEEPGRLQSMGLQSQT